MFLQINNGFYQEKPSRRIASTMPIWHIFTSLFGQWTGRSHYCVDINQRYGSGLQLIPLFNLIILTNWRAFIFTHTTFIFRCTGGVEFATVHIKRLCNALVGRSDFWPRRNICAVPRHSQGGLLWEVPHNCRKSR